MWLIKRRKIQYFGHIKQHNFLENIILEDMIPDRQGRGRPRNRWVKDVINKFRRTAAHAYTGQSGI
uniref:Uncharacterized protein n=1 Tax=Arion vulgaris TaxID=1028688 RepID=A0A0B6ZHV5_9EUPU